MGMIGAASSDKLLADLAREQAVREGGYTFIDLKLLDSHWNGVQGAMVLLASPYIDGTGMKKFSLSVQGGPLVFQYDQRRGGFFYQMVDDEKGWNRDFLRRHLDKKRFLIVDREIEAQIRGEKKEAVKGEATAKKTSKTLKALSGESEQSEQSESAVGDGNVGGSGEADGVNSGGSDDVNPVAVVNGGAPVGDGGGKKTPVKKTPAKKANTAAVPPAASVPLFPENNTLIIEE
jgi:hypothetical protein